MREIMSGALKLLIGVLLSVSGYWLKDNADATRKLEAATTDLKVLMAQMKAGQDAAERQIGGLERRLERLERGRLERGHLAQGDRKAISCS